MTRKEDLAQRATETTEQLLAEGVCLSDGECRITDRVILRALQQVEREVLERVAKHIKQTHYEEFGHDQLYGIEEELYEYFIKQKELG